jgi:hypothetical protein
MEAGGLNQWKIGDVKITRVVESEGPWDGTFILPNGTTENVQKESDWLYPAFSDENGKLRMAIQALAIESQGKRIIVDTCIGNDKDDEWMRSVILKVRQWGRDPGTCDSNTAADGRGLS